MARRPPRPTAAGERLCHQRERPHGVRGGHRRAGGSGPVRRVPARTGGSGRPAPRLSVHQLHAMRSALFPHRSPPLRPAAHNHGVLPPVPGLRARVPRSRRPPLPRRAERLPGLRTPPAIDRSRRTAARQRRIRAPPNRRGPPGRKNRRRERRGWISPHGRCHERGRGRRVAPAQAPGGKTAGRHVPRPRHAAARRGGFAGRGNPAAFTAGSDRAGAKTRRPGSCGQRRAGQPVGRRPAAVGSAAPAPARGRGPAAGRDQCEPVR